jgi:hypothetical protein
MAFFTDCSIFVESLLLKMHIVIFRYSANLWIRNHSKTNQQIYQLGDKS